MEQGKTSEKLNEMEMSNLVGSEFKIMIINMLNEHTKRIHMENFSKEWENIAIIKYTLDRINSRLDDREKWIS